MNEKDYDLTQCGAIRGCPKSVVNIEQLAKNIELALGECHTDDHFHHKQQKLRMALSGCPNCCAQNLIKDLAAYGWAEPKVIDGNCIVCGLCVQTCRERAISLKDNAPEIDRNRCLTCGECILTCPSGALTKVADGLVVTAGGILGRHPQLAKTVRRFAFEEGQQLILNLLEKFKSSPRTGEAPGQAIIRVVQEEVG